MQPALDEVQQAVNKAAQAVLGVSKGVGQWSKERKIITQVTESTPPGNQTTWDIILFCKSLYPAVCQLSFLALFVSSFHF